MQRVPITILALVLAWTLHSLATARADEARSKPKHKTLGADKSTAVPPPGTPSPNKPQAAYVYNISQNSITLEIPNLVSPSTIVAASPDMKELFDNERFMGKFGKLTTYPTIEGKHSVSLPTDLKKGEWIEAVIGTKTLYGYDGISMPTMQTVGFLSSVKRCTNPPTMAHFVVGHQYYMNNAENVFSDGTVTVYDDSSHLFVGHLPAERLAKLTALRQSVQALLDHPPDTSKNSGPDWMKLHSLTIDDKLVRIEPTDSRCAKLLEVLAQIRKELLLKAHRAVICQASYHITGNECKALQGQHDYYPTYELATFKNIKEFPPQVHYRLSGMVKHDFSGIRGISAELPDETYKSHKEFWDSIKDTDIYRQGDCLYANLRIDFGKALPPIEL